MKKYIAILIFSFALLHAAISSAQGIYYMQFDATPLNLNPAFTGTFNGNLRASTIYHNSWGQNNTLPFITTGISGDIPVLALKSGDYFAAGIQVLQDRVGDGDLQKISGSFSAAYHKPLTILSKTKCNSELSAGLQLGYLQKNYNVYASYFAYPSNFRYMLRLGNSVSYYAMNAGISFAHEVTNRFNYIVGISGYNLNQPSDNIEARINPPLGIDTRYAAMAGANWQITKRFSLRPAVYHEFRQHGNGFITGNEFSYSIGKKPAHNALFAGGWYTNDDSYGVEYMSSFGMEIRSFRVGISYVQNDISNTGFGFTIRYIHPHGGKRTIPCSRF